MANSSPDQLYGYLTPTFNYCYEEPEGYMADYPDSDILSERSFPPAGGQNIRVGHPATQDLYACDTFHSPETYYYNTPLPIPPPLPRRSRVSPVYCPCFNTPLDTDFRDHEIYGAPHHRIAKIAPRITRRHPVAVRTPRYFRRTMSNICKKPSVLCLPVVSRPDPAVCLRNKKPIYQYLPAGKNLGRRHSLPMQTPVAVNKEHEKELHMTQSSVDAVLARYDTICEGQGHRDNCGSISSKSSRNRKFKPKTPPSLKKEYEKNRAGRIDNKNPPSKLPDVESLEVEDITTEVLDLMLSELINSGSEKGATKDKLPAKSYDARAAGEGASIGNAQNTIFPSFNYHDISRNIKKSQPYVNTTSVPTPSTPKSSKADVTNIKKEKSGASLSAENSILELHRSKSYILSLIDRALSRELGTATDEAYPSIPKEVIQDSARQAAGTVKKHDRNCDNGLCLQKESNRAFAESEVKHESSCSCNVQEEPLYMKQLRQLKWGHLKHIQTEARRLEDLERFLDSCSSSQSN